jgi:hypothetical protein
MKRFITILSLLFIVLVFNKTTFAATASKSSMTSKTYLLSANGTSDKYASLTIVLDSVVSIGFNTSRAYFGYRNSSDDTIYICQDTLGSEAYTYNVMYGARSIDSALFYLQYFYPGEHHVLYGNEFPKYSGHKMSATFASTNVIVWTLGYTSMAVDQNGEVEKLPVEMTFFTASLQNTSALLKWSTATETNNAGFQIERRLEGADEWVKIKFIYGAGTSNVPKSYSYEDKNLAPGIYIYRIKQIDNDGTETLYIPNELPKVDVGTSNTLQLYGNYPNPFNPSTEIRFSVPQDGYASLKVYNIVGQEVATLFAGVAKAGHYIPVMFHASDLASGVYFSRLQYNSKSVMQRMLLTK